MKYVVVPADAKQLGFCVRGCRCNGAGLYANKNKPTIKVEKIK